MTKEEAKQILEAYIACESKKSHFECSEYNCNDDCPLLYGMGTVGEFNEAINMAIQALEQEPCEVEAAKLQQAYNKGFEDCRNAVLDLVNADWKYEGLEVPINSISPVIPKQKTGHWIFVDKAKEHAHCSECDYGNVDLFDGRPHNYCPNCGTRLSLLKPYLPDICVGNMSEIPTGSESEDKG